VVDKMAVPPRKNLESKVQISAVLYPILWDVDIDSIDIQKHKSFLIERILNYGDEDCYRWMFKTFTREEIMGVVKNSRRISPKSAAMMGNYYNISKGEIRCLNQVSPLSW